MPTTADLNECLRELALGVGSASDTSAVVTWIGRSLAPLDGLRLVGLGIYDARRRTLIVSTVGRRAGSGVLEPGPLSPEGEEFAADETDVDALATASPPLVTEDLTRGPTGSLQGRLYEAGVRRYIAAGLRAEGELLGALYAGFASDGSVSGDVAEHILRVAQVAAPAVWNRRIHTTLEKGGRRRAALIELSNAINTSLRFETVLQSARQAIAHVEGHRLSVIALLREDGQSYDAYPCGPAEGQRPQQRPAATVHQVRGSVLAWLLEHGRTFESDDLERGVTFQTDAALREAGARRYAAAPMFVRGRIIGAFLFGTQDPHPALTTDVWLYENIALQLALAIDNARQFEQLQRLSDRLAEQNVYLREEIDTEHDVEGMVGRTPVMKRLRETIARVGGTGSTVLIAGETGVGKELVARALHRHSPRADQPLVKVNCAAIPEPLVESELFGHERGAFTTAVARRIGRFELAREGTLFLDEVGELPASIQAKLLRVLQDGEFERVGGTETIHTDARIIAATNRDLLKAVADGAYRSDLYYRLHVFVIQVPPLAQRRDDIPLLVETFVQQFNRRMGKQVRSVDAASLEYLRTRDWPGNIRELRHVVERAMILCDGPTLIIEPERAGPTTRMSPPAASAERAPGEPPQPAAWSLDAIAREHIVRALRQTHGIIDGPRGAAVLLGLKPSTLRSRMKRLRVPRFSGR